MSVANQMEKVSLWREGLRTFRVNWREWLRIAIWFAVVIGIGYGIMIKGMFANMPDIQTKPGQPVTPEQQAILGHMMDKVFVWMAPLMLVILVKTYFFIVFFMRKQVIFGSPQATVGGFFGWLGHYVLLMIALVGVGCVALGVPMGIGFVAKGVMPASVPFILGIAGIVFLYFVMLRLYPIIILSVCNVKPLYKTSWKLTEGTCWRLIGNAILLMLICMVFWIAMIIVFAIVTAVIGFAVALVAKATIAQAAGQTTGGGPGYIVVLITSVIMGAAMTVFTGILWAFYCTAVRIFYQEKSAANPNFILTT